MEFFLYLPTIIRSQFEPLQFLVITREGNDHKAIRNNAQYPALIDESLKA